MRKRGRYERVRNRDGDAGVAGVFLSGSDWEALWAVQAHSKRLEEKRRRKEKVHRGSFFPSPSAL